MTQYSSFIAMDLSSNGFGSGTPPHHEATKSHFHPNKRDLNHPLEVFCETAATTHPCKISLNHPPSVNDGEHLNTFRLFHNLDPFRHSPIFQGPRNYALLG